MIIIKLTYLVDLTEVDKYLSAHREFLDEYFQKGLLLASGPLVPRSGGIIIAFSSDLAKVREIFKNDPYQLAEIADYEYFQFTPVKHCEEIKNLIENKEGNIC